MAENNNNNSSKWSLLRSLTTIVKKVSFLMNPDLTRLWQFSRVGRRSRRRLSFGEQLGLTAIVSSSDDDDEENGYNMEFGDSGSCSSKELKKTRSFHVQRTTSFREEDDVDKRAELFIENFYRQLRYERQVSLQLRYKRDASFGSSDSSSSSPSICS